MLLAEEAGDDLLTYDRFTRSQWKCRRTTNPLERLNEEFRRRTKTQGSFRDETSALVMLWGLVAFGQIGLRKIDGWQDMTQALKIAWKEAARGSTLCSHAWSSRQPISTGSGTLPFAAQHGLSLSTFCRWLRLDRSTAAAAFVRVDTPTPLATDFELVLVDGRLPCVPPVFDPAVLRALLEVLASCRRSPRRCASTWRRLAGQVRRDVHRPQRRDEDRPVVALVRTHRRPHVRHAAFGHRRRTCGRTPVRSP